MFVAVPDTKTGKAKMFSVYSESRNLPAWVTFHKTMMMMTVMRVVITVIANNCRGPIMSQKVH